MLYLEARERIMESPGATWKESLGWGFQEGIDREGPWALREEMKK